MNKIFEETVPELDGSFWQYAQNGTGLWFTRKLLGVKKSHTSTPIWGKWERFPGTLRGTQLKETGSKARLPKV